MTDDKPDDKPDETRDKRDVRDDEPNVEASADDIERVSAALRATAPRRDEPDWAKLAGDIGAAVDGEVRRQRRVRAWAIGGAVLAAAVVAALLVWPVDRAQRDAGAGARATAPVDAAPAAPDESATAPDLASADPLDDDLVEELAVPDDLGGMTLDDELVDEAAAAIDRGFGDAEDALDDGLLPDGTWIDQLSDEELELAVAILDREAG